MNFRNRIRRLEITSGINACNCPDIIVIRPGADNPKLCKRCLTEGETVVIFPSLEVSPEYAEILSGAGKVYGGFNPDLV
jgi:hypothetical protein